MVAARVAHRNSQQQLDQAQQAVQDTQDAQERLTAQLHDTSAQLQLVSQDLATTKYENYNKAIVSFTILISFCSQSGIG